MVFDFKIIYKCFARDNVIRYGVKNGNIVFIEANMLYNIAGFNNPAIYKYAYNILKDGLKNRII